MNSLFWKAMAVAAIASVFYLGDGLHERHGVTLSDLERSASAADAPGAAVKKVYWESVPFDFPPGSSRRPVPGGWIVGLTQANAPIGSREVGMTFVPDPDHKWKP